MEQNENNSGGFLKGVVIMEVVKTLLRRYLAKVALVIALGSGTYLTIDYSDGELNLDITTQEVEQSAE